MHDGVISREATLFCSTVRTRYFKRVPGEVDDLRAKLRLVENYRCSQLARRFRLNSGQVVRVTKAGTKMGTALCHCQSPLMPEGLTVWCTARPKI